MAARLQPSKREWSTKYQTLLQQERALWNGMCREAEQGDPQAMDAVKECQRGVEKEAGTLRRGVNQLSTMVTDALEGQEAADAQTALSAARTVLDSLGEFRAVAISSYTKLVSGYEEGEKELAALGDVIEQQRALEIEPARPATGARLSYSPPVEQWCGDYDLGAGAFEIEAGNAEPSEPEQRTWLAPHAAPATPPRVPDEVRATAVAHPSPPRAAEPLAHEPEPEAVRELASKVASLKAQAASVEQQLLIIDGTRKRRLRGWLSSEIRLLRPLVRRIGIECQANPCWKAASSHIQDGSETGLPKAIELCNVALTAARSLLATADGNAESADNTPTASLLVSTRSVDECALAAAAEATADVLQTGRAAISRVWRSSNDELNQAREALVAAARRHRDAKEAEEAATRAKMEAKMEAERRRKRRNQLAVWRAEKQKADEERARQTGEEEAGAVSAAVARAERRAVASRRRLGQWHAAGRPKQNRTQTDTLGEEDDGNVEKSSLRRQSRVESSSSLRDRASAAVQSGNSRLRRIQQKRAVEEAARLRSQGLVARVKPSNAKPVIPAAATAADATAADGECHSHLLEVRAPTSVLRQAGKGRDTGSKPHRNPGRVYRPTAATKAGSISGDAVVKRAAVLASAGAHGRPVPSTKGTSIRKGIDYTFGGPTRVRAVPAWRKGL